jgi:hypothetical protein
VTEQSPVASRSPFFPSFFPAFWNQHKLHIKSSPTNNCPCTLHLLHYLYFRASLVKTTTLFKILGQAEVVRCVIGFASLCRIFRRSFDLPYSPQHQSPCHHAPRSSLVPFRALNSTTYSLIHHKAERRGGIFSLRITSKSFPSIFHLKKNFNLFYPTPSPPLLPPTPFSWIPQHIH